MTPRSPRALLTATALAGALVAAPSVDAAPGDTAGAGYITWQLDLDHIDGDRVNVVARNGTVEIRHQLRSFASLGGRGTFGMVTFRPRTLDTAVNRIRASVAASVPPGTSVEVGVRGHSRHGWTEWTEVTGQSPAILSQRTARVQVRLVLHADGDGKSPTVSHIRLTGDSVPTTKRARRSAPRSYNVFATREGLVGETTANGHVIERRDHFVALPSTRSLAPRGRGDYSVKVCSSETGRCAFAPVWDVGPWNIHDDYWNPPSVRENWSDLPQGVPEAEAAYKHGYHNGKDGSGREVLNPAGIDLADGTFWDAVGLHDNAWVDVTYLWTGTYPATGEVVTARTPLRVRAAPNTDAAEVGLAGQHAMVPIFCQTRGERVDGYAGTTDLWNRIGPDMYISDAYTHTGSDGMVAPRC